MLQNNHSLANSDWFRRLTYVFTLELDILQLAYFDLMKDDETNRIDNFLSFILSNV